MSSSDRRRYPKLKKKGLPEHKELVTQDDWYEEAVKLEDGAERWFLSDIRKTLKGYSEAMVAYERALNAENSNAEDTYNIHYNQTRLLLKIYTDYANVDGYINLLQYVNLDGLDLSSVITSIETIVTRFETVLQAYPEKVGWDFLFNTLISYYTFIESENNTSGYALISTLEHFISHFHHLINLELELLESEERSDNVDEAFEEAQFQRDNLAEQSKINLNTGGGIKTREEETAKTELALSTEAFDKEVMTDSLALGYKLVYEVMATICRTENLKDEMLLNIAQKNYLTEMLSKFVPQLDEMAANLEAHHPHNFSELVTVKKSIESLKWIYQRDLESFLKSLDNSDKEGLMSNVELLELAVETFPPEKSWEIRTHLSKTLANLQNILAKEQSDIITGRIKNKDNELSPIVFKLCDIMINRSDNELYRCMIKKAELDQHPEPHTIKEGHLKTIEILERNATTLLTNAKDIAHRSCGFSEYITDKLKRNYIFGQATLRLQMLESTSTALPEDLEDHPYYQALHSAVIRI